MDNDNKKKNTQYVPVKIHGPNLPEEVFQAELDDVKNRRKNMGIPPVCKDVSTKGPSVKHGLVGLALSGGGIRSSTFNLGILQALNKVGLLRYVDYLSTVSGGGYIGSCLSSLFAGATDTSFDEVEITGIPEGSALSNGKDLGNGRWHLTAKQLKGLKLTLPLLDSDKKYDTIIWATAIKKLASDDNVTQTEQFSIPVYAGSLPDSGLSLKYFGTQDKNTLKIKGNPKKHDACIDLFIGPKKFPFPFIHEEGKQESAEFKHLRKYSNYLTPPKPFASLRLPGLFLRGLLVNALIILPLLLILAIGTAFLTKNNIGDALSTREIEYTIPKQTSGKEPHSSKEYYREYTIDLRSYIQWDRHDEDKLILISGLDPNTKPEPDENSEIISLAPRKNSEISYLIKSKDSDNIKLTLTMDDPNKDFDFSIIMGEINQFRESLDFINKPIHFLAQFLVSPFNKGNKRETRHAKEIIEKNPSIIKKLLALYDFRDLKPVVFFTDLKPFSWFDPLYWFFDIKKSTASVKKADIEQNEGKGKYYHEVGWNNFIILSGLPQNSYSLSKDGKFLAKEGKLQNKRRWLFDGEAADDLKLTMLLPPLESDITIKAKAWQSNDDSYQTVQGCKRIMKLPSKDIRSNITWQENAGTRYLMLFDLPKGFDDRPIGEKLSEDRWVFIEDEIDEMYKDPNSKIENWYDPNQALGVMAWQSGRDASFLDPVSRIYRNTFDWKVILLIVAFIFLLAGYPFIMTLIKSNHESGPWSQRNFLAITLLCIVIAIIVSIPHFISILNLQANPIMILIQILAVFAPPVIACVLILKLIRLLHKSRPWRQRDLLTRYLCGGGIALIMLVVFFELQPLAIYLFYSIPKSLKFHNIITVTGGLVVALNGLVSSRAFSKGNKLIAKLSLYVMGIIGPIVVWLFYLSFCGWLICPKHLPVALSKFTFISNNVTTSFFIVALVTYFLTRWFYDINMTSIHPFYRDRLSKAFLFRSGAKSGDIIHNDEQKLSELNTSCSPYHIINTTLNIQGKSKTNMQGRVAEFFIFTREYVGSQITGYRRIKEYEDENTDMGLATAMSISAAAAAPNMGQMKTKNLTFIMALLNIRLGYWAQNPGYFNSVHGFWQKLWRIIYPNKVGPIYLLREMMGMINEESRYINLSDGGHLENMGLYELVRRRCRFIIVSDAEADAKMAFNGLADSIRMIRIDMGIRIVFDKEHGLDKICQEGKKKGLHYAIATIHYKKDSEEDKGILLYIKSTMSGDENVYINNYKAIHPDFPHESTADQFFDEAQFEAYRALGSHIGRRVFSDRNVKEKFLEKIENADRNVKEKFPKKIENAAHESETDNT